MVIDFHLCFLRTHCVCAIPVMIKLHCLISGQIFVIKEIKLACALPSGTIWTLHFILLNLLTISFIDKAFSIQFNSLFSVCIIYYFGHLMGRTDSLGKILMLGKTEGKRRGWQRVRWLDSITDSMDMSLRILQEIVKDRKAWHDAAHGVTKSQWLNNNKYMCSVAQLSSTLFDPKVVLAHQALSMEFSRQEYWSGCHFILQVIFLTEGSNPSLLSLLHWQMDSLPLAPPGKSHVYAYVHVIYICFDRYIH